MMNDIQYYIITITITQQPSNSWWHESTIYTSQQPDWSIIYHDYLYWNLKDLRSLIWTMTQKFFSLT